MSASTSSYQQQTGARDIGRPTKDHPTPTRPNLPNERAQLKARQPVQLRKRINSARSAHSRCSELCKQAWALYQSLGPTWIVATRVGQHVTRRQDGWRAGPAFACNAPVVKHLGCGWHRATSCPVQSGQLRSATAPWRQTADVPNTNSRCDCSCAGHGCSVRRVARHRPHHSAGRDERLLAHQRPGAAQRPSR
jgi:hypothetical protein